MVTAQFRVYETFFSCCIAKYNCRARLYSSAYDCSRNTAMIDEEGSRKRTPFNIIFGIPY
jgi:hypothetical protein